MCRRGNNNLLAAALDIIEKNLETSAREKSILILYRKNGSNISFAKNLFKFSLAYTFHFSKSGKVPW